VLGVLAEEPLGGFNFKRASFTAEQLPLNWCETLRDRVIERIERADMCKCFETDSNLDSHNDFMIFRWHNIESQKNGTSSENTRS
jgi:hypothetical protein